MYYEVNLFKILKFKYRFSVSYGGRKAEFHHEKI